MFDIDLTFIHNTEVVRSTLRGLKVSKERLTKVGKFSGVEININNFAMESLKVI